MAATETLFTTLPFRLQDAIDEAFDAYGQTNRRESSSGDPRILGGGFITEAEPKMTHIKFSSIPSALKQLELPQDEEVLSVFRNAASGWSSSQSEKVDGERIGEGLVSREDWRSVCAVLLENDGEQDVDMDDISQNAEAEADTDEEYSASEVPSEDDDEDDYRNGLAQRKTGHKRARIETSRSISPEARSNYKLNKLERQAAQDAFALFFPSVPLAEVKDQKIMLKDIQRAAKLLNEKIKAEEMVDMLEAFSTSPDKSITLEDFSRIMVAANLL